MGLIRWQTYSIVISTFLLLFIFTFCLRDEVTPSYYITFIPLWIFIAIWALSLLYNVIRHMPRKSARADRFPPNWSAIFVEFIALLGFSTSAVFIALKLADTISWINWIVFTPVLASLIVILAYSIYTFPPRHNWNKQKDVVEEKKVEEEEIIEENKTSKSGNQFVNWDE